MPIGQAAHHRRVNKHPDINIVEKKKDDNMVTKQVKVLIRDMTQVSPERRPAAKSVLRKLNAMVSYVFYARGGG